MRSVKFTSSFQIRSQNLKYDQFFVSLVCFAVCSMYNEKYCVILKIHLEYGNIQPECETLNRDAFARVICIDREAGLRDHQIF